ncbi:nucleotidyltransferase domain-containing protein [Bacillus sp. RC250]|uniref:nucleotidyltransferase domain-containing protein n=1 Tax=Bacillus sp. RC250 TaxID=3156287 RepID=UPI003834183F
MIKQDFRGICDLLSVVLFGSTAREDGDEYSDVDIFLLVEDVTQSRIEEIIDTVKSELGYKNIGISLYRKSIYNKLLLEGSMFLWHLKLEGKIIYSRENLILFKDLKPFNNYNKNLSTYENLYIQTKKSLKINGINAFDLSQLFFICRNVSLLACFKLGYPTFGRETVYSKLVNCIGVYPIDWDNYIYLSKWRLNYSRGIESEINYPTEEELLNLLKQMDDLINICEEIIRLGGNHE